MLFSDNVIRRIFGRMLYPSVFDQHVCHLFLINPNVPYFMQQDLIKKRSLEYKGRIVLENYKFEKLEDGEGT